VTLSARWVVLDIEGTLTATSQVHVVLYDYARPRLGPWIDEHPDDPVVAGAVEQVKELGGLPATAGTAEVVEVLHTWMAAELGADSGDILFLSDVPAELDATALAGWQTVGLARAGEPFADADFGPHRTIRSFAEIRVTAR
jgi:methionine salvage enolase-phosphatase E1